MKTYMCIQLEKIYYYVNIIYIYITNFDKKILIIQFNRVYINKNLDILKKINFFQLTSKCL